MWRQLATRRAALAGGIPRGPAEDAGSPRVPGVNALEGFCPRGDGAGANPAAVVANVQSGVSQKDDGDRITRSDGADEQLALGLEGPGEAVFLACVGRVPIAANAAMWERRAVARERLPEVQPGRCCDLRALFAGPASRSPGDT